MLSLASLGNASFYLHTQLTSFVLHPKLSLVLLQYDFRVAFLSPAGISWGEPLLNVKMRCT